MQRYNYAINLSTTNQKYEEAVVRASDTAKVLAGSIVMFKDEQYEYQYYKTEDVPPEVKLKCKAEALATKTYTKPVITQNETIERLYVGTTFEEVVHHITTTETTETVTEANYDITSFEPYVIIENALFGKSFNHQNFVGEVARCRRLVPEDKFLLRAVVGNYRPGDALYATQTANGIYVTKQSGGMFIGWCEEAYDVTEDMMDLVDTYQFPMTGGSLNQDGVQYVNLVAVRIGKAYNIVMTPVSGVSFSLKSAINPYDGNSHPLSDYFNVSGAQDSDTVTYKITNSDDTTVTNAGTYSVTATVQRSGYSDYTTTLQLTIPTKQLTLTGTTVASRRENGSVNIADKVTLGTLNDTTGNVSVNIVSAELNNKSAGSRTATITYEISGSGFSNYTAPVSEQIAVEITPALTVSDYSGVYDGTAHSPAITGVLAGEYVKFIYNGHENTVSVESDGVIDNIPSFTNVGTNSISIVLYNADMIEICTKTASVEITKATRTGITFTGVTGSLSDASSYSPTLSGTIDSDTIVYSYDDMESSTVPEFTDTGTYVVDVTVSNPNYTDWTGSATVHVTGSIEYSLVISPTTGTTTNLVATFTEELESVADNQVTVSGDAERNGDFTFDGTVLTIPIKITKTSGADSYTAKLKIDAGNIDNVEKQVSVNLVTCYWGCYPCQLSGSTTPTAEQVKLGTPVTGTLPATLNCGFTLYETDWNNEVANNNITGEAAGYANGSGYEYFLYTWDADVDQIMNAESIDQTDAFVDFNLEIDGIAYTGKISKLPASPSGSSPYTVFFE